MPVCFRWVYEEEASLVADWWRRKQAEERAVAEDNATSSDGTAKRARRPQPASEHGLLLALHRDSFSGDSAGSATSASSSENEEDSNDAGEEEEDKAAEKQRRSRQLDRQADSRSRHDLRRQRRLQARDDVAQAHNGQVPLRAAATAPFPFNRASGIDYFVSSAASGVAGDGAVPSLAEVPCGEAYYYALRARWSAPVLPNSAAAAEVAALPPLADENELDDSLIMDCISDDYKGELAPPVPLGYMIDSLVPDWEDDGLYEIAYKREAQATQQAKPAPKQPPRL